jgi:hypothetical protein
MKRFAYLIPMLMLVAFIGCTQQEDEFNDSQAVDQDIVTVLKQVSNNTKAGKRPQPPIWVDCIAYTGIVTPATFKPVSHSFDELYAMPNANFKDGKPLISDSKPGDQDYNGGRWHLNVLKEGVDPAKYAYACMEEDLDLNDFESTPMYFGCPLRPVNK